MASFTDKIPTFNPYVEQQPVDAMLKVGVYKQQKYEDGIKKIQTSIDNVAGLDIANPVQQQYLQSKLNSLGNNLTLVAAGDFSDFSLVNSVNGMTKQIVKDEDIQNAVNSTAKLRAGYKKREELSKKGLTDKNNDDYYDQFAQEYVNSKDLKASFRADYVPYTNIVKKLQQALVNAGESSTVAEQLFVTDPNTGKPMIIDGHYRYADAKTIDKLVTNRPAVLAAIENVMNEGDVKQQLGIDGWATYRNTEATTLLEPLKIQYDDERSKLEQQSLEASAMLNSTNLSDEQKQLYIKTVSDIEANLLKNDNMFLSLSQQAEDSPEQFKQSYYTQEFKQRLINQFVKEEKSQTTGVNEALQQQNWRQTFAFNEKVESNKIAYQNAQLDLSRSSNQREWMKFYGDYEQDPVTGNWNKKPEPGKSGSATYNANKPLFSGAAPGDKVSAVNIVQEDINTLSEAKNKLAFSLYADIVRASNDNATASDEAIYAKVKQYAKKLKVTPEAFLDRWATNIKNKYDEAGLTPPPNLEDDFNNYMGTASVLNNKKNQYDQALVSANKEAGVDKILNELTKDRSTFTYTTRDNEKFTITPGDMIAMMKDGQLKMLSQGSWGINAKGKLKINYKNLTDKQNKFLSNWWYLSPQARDKVREEIANYGDKPNEYYSALDKSDKLFNEKLSKIAGVSDTVTGFLPMDSDSKSATVGKVAAYVNGGERNYGEGADRTAVLKALDNAKTISWKGKKPTNSKEDWIGEIIVSGEDGVPYTITNVNRKDLTTFTDSKFTDYKDQPIQDALNINEKTKSTNPIYMPNSPNAWRTAYFKGNQVNPEVTKAGWIYRADVVKSNGGYRLVNYIKPPNSQNFITVYGAAIAADENIIDNTYKTTTPAQLNAMYINYLHNQNKQ